MIVLSLNFDQANIWFDPLTHWQIKVSILFIRRTNVFGMEQKSFFFLLLLSMRLTGRMNGMSTWTRGVNQEVVSIRHTRWPPSTTDDSAFPQYVFPVSVSFSFVVWHITNSIPSFFSCHQPSEVKWRRKKNQTTNFSSMSECLAACLFCVLTFAFAYAKSNQATTIKRVGGRQLTMTKQRNARSHSHHYICSSISLSW